MCSILAVVSLERDRMYVWEGGGLFCLCLGVKRGVGGAAVALMRFFLAVCRCLGGRTCIDADVPRLVLQSPRKNDVINWLQQSKVHKEMH